MKPIRVLFAALLLSLLPFESALAKKAEPAAVSLPLVGSVAGGGAIGGSFTINRFALQNGELVAIGFVRATVSTAQGVRTGLQTIALPVNTSRLSASLSLPPAGTARLVPAALIRAQASCGVLHLEILGENVNLLGVIVTLSPITLDISGDAAGPLGALVCEIVALLGSVADVVGLLNNLLGVLTGLLGGLIGGLG